MSDRFRHMKIFDIDYNISNLHTHIIYSFVYEVPKAPLNLLLDLKAEVWYCKFV